MKRNSIIQNITQNITQDEYDKSVMKTGKSLHTLDSRVGKKNRPVNSRPVMYKDGMRKTSSEKDALAKVIGGHVSSYYLKYSGAQHVLFDVKDRGHILGNSEWVWREVGAEAFDQYSNFLSTHRRAFYQAASSKMSM
jgi:hypothetical protein